MIAEGLEKALDDEEGDLEHFKPAKKRIWQAVDLVKSGLDQRSNSMADVPHSCH
jgi:hypothetical protein